MYFISKRYRINKFIKVPTVRLVSDKAEQLGIMSIEKALKLAEDIELDLVEVAPKANPPVCKIMDYGKFQYHQKKVETRHRKMQKKAEVKGVRIGFKTGEGDLKIKAKQAKKFLESGNIIKVTLIFKGREAMYKDLAKEKMKTFYQELEETGNLEATPKSQGNTLIMIITPKK
ncbi:translation initiation factor IF-3 [Patescibacteria group bacterium]